MSKQYTPEISSNIVTLTLNDKQIHDGLRGWARTLKRRLPLIAGALANLKKTPEHITSYIVYSPAGSGLFIIPVSVFYGSESSFGVEFRILSHSAETDINFSLSFTEGIDSKYSIAISYPNVSPDIVDTLFGEGVDPEQGIFDALFRYYSDQSKTHVFSIKKNRFIDRPQPNRCTTLSLFAIHIAECRMYPNMGEEHFGDVDPDTGEEIEEDPNDYYLEDMEDIEGDDDGFGFSSSPNSFSN